MNNLDKEKYRIRYNERLALYGYDPKALGWGGGIERQEIRYKNLLDISHFTARLPHSVLDVGCGFADLLNYLKKTIFSPDIRYLGVDINEELLKVAQLQHGNSINIQCYDILSDSLDTCITKTLAPYDLVVESGIFNYKLDHENQNQYIRDMLQRMFDIASLGVAADFMTTHVDWEADGAFHMDPAVLLDIAYSITPRVIIRHDYMPYEYCVYLIR